MEVELNSREDVVGNHGKTYSISAILPSYCGRKRQIYRIYNGEISRADYL